MSVEQHSSQSWWESRRAQRERITGTEWAANFDIIHALAPFEYRSYDPVEIVAGARERLEELPPTAATIKPHQLMRAVDTSTYAPTHLDTLFMLAGSWPTGESGSKERYYANPEYVHLESVDWAITDPRERVEHLRRCASIGTLSTADIAPRFGFSHRGSLTAWFHRHELPWGEWRRWGQRRIGRTAEVIHDWSGRLYSEIAEALGLAETTLHHCRRHHVRESAWTVPEDPSADPKFASGYSGAEGDDV